MTEKEIVYHLGKLANHWLYLAQDIERSGRESVRNKIQKAKLDVQVQALRKCANDLGGLFCASLNGIELSDEKP